MDSSIQVGVSGPTVWVRVEGKGSFLNSGNLKEFARQMLDRGYREFVVDLADCAMMDSTFMGTMASVALRLFTAMARGRLTMKRSSEPTKTSRQRPKKRSRQKRCWKRTRRFARQRRKISFALRTFSIS